MEWRKRMDSRLKFNNEPIYPYELGEIFEFTNLWVIDENHNIIDDYDEEEWYYDSA